VPLNSVLVLGAGASVSEAKRHRPKRDRDRPPLDATFFRRVARHAHPSTLRAVVDHAAAIGQPDLCGTSPAVSLEEHLGRLYFALATGPSTDTRRAYYDLINLYSDELRQTTSWLDGRAGHIRALVQTELDRDRKVSVLTFNHDLLIENALSLLPSRWGKAWCLRHVYGFGEKEIIANNEPRFDYECSGRPAEHVPILKLHGSMNWVFRTLREHPPEEVTRKDRELLIWTNRVLTPGVRRMGGPTRDWYIWSLIVPPIYEKHGFIRAELSEVWKKADTALRSADRVIFWGYSFPRADLHARYFFSAAAHENEALRNPVLVNPDPAAHREMWSVLKPSRVERYRDIEDYFASDL
jgi:hypothetical protein